MLLRRFYIIEGVWLFLLGIFVKLLFGFLYGLLMAVLRPNVMSRKSTTFFFGFNSDLQVVVFEDCAYFFLIASTCLGSFVQVSPYNPTLISR